MNGNRESDRKEINRLAYEAASKALAQQEALVASIRQRATAIGGLAGFTAAFLGREALKDRPTSVDCAVEVQPDGGASELCQRGVETASNWVFRFDIFETIALTLLVLTIIAIIQILRPRNGYKFGAIPSKIIDQFSYGDRSTGIEETLCILAEYGEEDFTHNEEIIKWQFVWLWVALLGTFGQLIAWLVAVA